MKRALTSQHKRRSVNRTASVGLIDFLKQRYDKTMPVSFITAAHKLYGKGKILSKEDRFIKRYSDSKGTLNTNKLIDYLAKGQLNDKSKTLNEQTMKRVYANCSNQDSKLTFEYIMKMGEKSGLTITKKMAEGIVRRFGRRKDHLNLEDCMRVNQRRIQTSGVRRGR